MDFDKTQQFCTLPKIHKHTQNPPDRPIVEGSRDPNQKMSQFWTIYWPPDTPFKVIHQVFQPFYKHSSRIKCTS